MEEELGVAVRAARCLEPARNALDEPGGRRERLAERQAPARLVEGDDVGERAADVGGQADARGAAHSGR